MLLYKNIKMLSCKITFKKTNRAKSLFAKKCGERNLKICQKTVSIYVKKRFYSEQKIRLDRSVCQRILQKHETFRKSTSN